MIVAAIVNGFIEDDLVLVERSGADPRPIRALYIPVVDDGGSDDTRLGTSASLNIPATEARPNLASAAPLSLCNR